MQISEFVCWKEGDVWLGYLEAWPDYWTQGETIEDLKDHLEDLFRHLTHGL